MQPPDVPPQSALSEYEALLLPLRQPQRADEDYLQYYSVGGGSDVKEQTLSRREFSSLISKALNSLILAGLRKGDCVLHNLSANRVEDLAYRAASVFLGTVPVTVNWQADSEDQLIYKLEITSARAVLYDAGSIGMDALRTRHPSLTLLPCNELSTNAALNLGDWIATNAADMPTSSDIRCIIFTSGTTGRPKGVQLSYSNYLCNRLTFEQFLGFTTPAQSLSLVVVNPLHHTNSTSMTDWWMRRASTVLRLVERYSGAYWAVIVSAVADCTIAESLDAAQRPLERIERPNSPIRRRVVAPLVSRHLDFLESLLESDAVPLVSGAMLTAALKHVTLLLGSAPVGPSTVARVQKYAGGLPTVRFGSTETTLQVCGVPLSSPQDEVMRAFRRGWEHMWGDAPCVGYYVGQQHCGHTEVRVVRGVDPGQPHLFLVACEEGEPGLLVTRGAHVMQRYVGDERASIDATWEGWYLRLGDVGFYLASPINDAQDIYWQSRESQLLIRGGANYSYEQICAELIAFLCSHFSLGAADARVAVCGVKVGSEHEDSCCVLLELGCPQAAEHERARLQRCADTFVTEARGRVSKGARPDFCLLGSIPMVQSKGVVDVPAMQRLFKEHLGL